MKALYCYDCHDIVVPFDEPRPRSCKCGRHSIQSGGEQTIHLHDRDGTRDAAHVIRIFNGFLRYAGNTTAHFIDWLLRKTARQHFKDQRSVITKTRADADPHVVWLDRMDMAS